MIDTWKKNYAIVPEILGRIATLGGVASVFNANLDAIVQVEPERFDAWISLLPERPDLSKPLARKIASPGDLIQGLINGFKHGIAQEWLIQNEATFVWLQKNLGYDKLQMGGQGGIIANVMSVAGVPKVFVHTASHEAQQAQLFLDHEGLLASDGHDLKPARQVNRKGDVPLMHWILEFKKGQELHLGKEHFTCPKSNRFIATYDPLNFDMHLDPAFAKALKSPELKLDVVLMSGFQMLSEELSNGMSGVEKIESIWNEVEQWRVSHPGMMVHLEFASTQNVHIRQAVADKIAHRVDSIGLNEQELIDILEMIDHRDLAEACRSSMDAPTLFEGTLAVYRYFKPYRCQLHMFGLYLTLTRETRPEKLLAMRNGMALAATLAATKAATGSLEDPRMLLHGHGQQIWGPAVEEMMALSIHLSKLGVNEEAFQCEGMAILPECAIVAIPTILVEKPVSLVGMGDTISSLSLVGSLV